MGKAAQLASAGQELAGDLLSGASTSTTIKDVAKATGMSVNEQAMHTVVEAAGQLAKAEVKPGATATIAEAAGQLAKAEVKQLGAALPGAEAELKQQVRDRLKAVTNLPKAAVARQAVAAVAAENTGTVIVGALKDLEKELPGLEGKVKPIWSSVLGAGDVEEVAAAIAKRGVEHSALTAAEASKFLRAVHDRLCDGMLTQLDALLKDPEIVAKVRAALTALREPSQTVAELAPLFRERIRAIVAAEAGTLLVRVVDRLIDPIVRRDFLERLFTLMCEKYAAAVIKGHYDASGMRRILAALDSFRKEYTAAGRLKAMENLIGWMYEASPFTADAVRSTAEAFRGQLGTVLSGPAYKDLGLTVGEAVLMHFEVNAPSLGKAALRQATDVMATVPISLGQGKGQRTVHVVASALESKGERGVLAGIRQVIEKLLLRFRKGAPVTTEHMSFTMGKDLFLTVEDAVRSLRSDVDASTARKIAAEARSEVDRYRALVVSPLPEDVALKRYPGSFGPGAKPGEKVTYLRHPITREDMVAVVQGLAAVFGLK
ncbi:MAG TPA: hypothetical protein VKB69_04060 [Micromonosporaceae bacterium]|nr:hypothetical protein [Micromonosporaceae bacterium]